MYTPKMTMHILQLVLLGIIATLLLNTHLEERRFGINTGTVVLLSGLVLFSIGLHDFVRLIPHDGNLSLKQYVQMYVVRLRRRLRGWYEMRKLQKQTKRCKETQEAFLLRLLSKNERTQYGKKYCFDQVTSRDAFRNLVPVITYGDIKKYIHKETNGVKNVLTAEHILMLASTSGTSGERHKKLVITKPMEDIYGDGALSSLIDEFIPNEHFPSFRTLRPLLRISAITPLKTSETCCYPIGSVSALGRTNTMSIVSVEPDGVVQGLHSQPKTVFYIKLLFAVKQPGLGAFGAIFGSILYFGLRVLEKRWKQMVNDIAFGRVDPQLDLPGEARKRINSYLQPDPKRASELNNEFSKGFEGIVQRIWPHVQFVSAIDSGASALYGDLLKKKYCKGLPVYNDYYGCSEGAYAINPFPNSPCRSYLPLINHAFWEFIRFDHEDDNHITTLFADEVEKGKLYEAVVTTYNGLYRYRLGDVFRVVGFYNHCPLLEFHTRLGEAMNVTGEKIPEPILYEAVKETISGWPGAALHDYTFTTGILLATITGDDSYELSPVVFVELFEAKIECNICEEDKAQFDEALRRLDHSYNLSREEELVQKAVLYIVHPGTFADFASYLCGHVGTSWAQLKIPRCLKREEDIRFMLDRVID